MATDPGHARMPLMDRPLQHAPSPRESAAASASGRRLRQLVDQAHPPTPDRRLVAVVSDLHLHAAHPYERIPDFYVAGVDSNAQVELALRAVAAADPGLLLLGGDLADSIVDGCAPVDEYGPLQRMLRQLVPQRLPVLAIAGNHDHSRGPLPAPSAAALARVRRGHPASAIAGDFCWAADWQGWRVIGLDTRDGVLAASQRDWLEGVLAQGDAPILLAMHRPILPCGNWVDNHRMNDAALTRRLLDCPRVRLIVSGHTHRPRAWRFGGQVHLIAPSTSYGIGAATGWSLAVLHGQRIEAAYAIGLPRPSQDHPSRRLLAGDCRIRRLPLRDVLMDQLFDPCVIPRP